MYGTHTRTNLFVTGTLLTCLCVSFGSASAYDWTDFLEMGLSEVPSIYSGPDSFDGFGDFRSRGNYSRSDGYYRGNNRGNYGRTRHSGVHTPPNTIPEVILEPMKNQKFSIMSRGLAPADIADAQHGAGDEIKDAIGKFALLVPNNDALATEIETSTINESQHARIYGLTQAGDTNRLRKLFLDISTEGTPAEHESILEQADARGQLKSVLHSAIAGTLNLTQLQDMKTAMMPFLPSSSGNPTSVALTQADELVNKLSSNSTIMRMLESAVPGLTTISVGPDANIISSPNFPAGTVIPLGPNSVIVGSMNPNAGTIVGTGSVLEAAGAPFGTRQPVQETSRKDITGGVYIINSADSPVAYVLNRKYEFTMESGHHQHLRGGRNWTIVFDRGGSHGTARYDLTGSYRFEMRDSGWELFRKTFDTTIDNTANMTDFHYVLNNKKHVVEAGESKGHKGLTYPPLIRFDNGNDVVKKKALSEGRYSVLIGGDDHGWELFTAHSQDRIPNVLAQTSIKHDPLRLFVQPTTSSDDERFFGASNVRKSSGWTFVDETSSSIFK